MRYNDVHLASRHGTLFLVAQPDESAFEVIVMAWGMLHDDIHESPNVMAANITMDIIVVQHGNAGAQITTPQLYQIIPSGRSLLARPIVERYFTKVAANARTVCHNMFVVNRKHWEIIHPCYKLCLTSFRPMLQKTKSNADCMNV